MQNYNPGVSEKVKKKILYIALFVFFFMIVAAVDNYLREHIPLLKPMTVVVIIAIAITTTLTYTFVTPAFWEMKRFRNPFIRFFIALSLTVVTVAIYAFVTRSFANLIPGGTMRFSKLFKLDLILHTMPMMGVGYFIALWKQTEMEKTLALEEAVNAKVALLYSQLTPHTLFNSLNTIAHFAHESSKDTEACVLSLADYFKGLSGTTSRPKISLEEERLIVASYLKFESFRLHGKLNVVWSWDDSLNTIKVIPLLFQPMIENAIKHGIAACTEGGEVRIILSGTKHTIKLAVENTGRPLFPAIKKEPDQNYDGLGIGTENLKNRLKLAYGNNASFCLYTKDDWTVAEIIINRMILKTKNSDKIPINHK